MKDKIKNPRKIGTSQRERNLQSEIPLGGNPSSHTPSRRMRSVLGSFEAGLPKAIATKIYKTGQTRGADKDTIFQNRVGRSSTVLIPIASWRDGAIIPPRGFENGYIVLARPREYFSATPPIPRSDLPSGLVLGQNLLVFYETRQQWNDYPPDSYGWTPARSRQPPLGGQYIARVPDTTSASDIEIRRGYIDNATGGQGAGIRVFEYASSEEIQRTRYQLAFLAWRTEGILELAASEGVLDPAIHKARIDHICEQLGLGALNELRDIRVINDSEQTICPLCRRPITALELRSRAEQAEGRDVPDLTITSANLFHIKEVRVNEFNHCSYNLGWGHYHCNTVVRDWGVLPTIKWICEVLRMNGFTVDRLQKK